MYNMSVCMKIYDSRMLNNCPNELFVTFYTTVRRFPKELRNQMYDRAYTVFINVHRTTN